MTGLEYITAALEELGILAPGETADVDDIAFGIRKFNRMLNSWSADGINLHYRPHETFPLVGADADYTIGASGADITNARPNVIETAFIRDSNGHDHPVLVRPISEYWRIGEKATQSRPTRLYYDQTYPNGTIYVFPTPSEAETMHIVSQKVMTNLTDQTTEISLPVEYQDAIVGDLAVRMAPAYGKSISIELASTSRAAYGLMKGRNLANTMKSVNLNIPGTRMSSYNIDEG